MSQIHGQADPRFDRLSDLLSASIDAGTDVGASVSVTIEGETIVDLWGGWTDESRSTPWQQDTIVNVWSTTKTMLSLAALVCVERGLIDLDASVATYWPEFAANGKEHVLVKHLLSHTSGVSGWDTPVELEDVYDWEKSTAMLAAQAPWWIPGTASGYHGFNQGHLVGEVIRRVTGLKFGEFFATEIAKPLDLDFHIGLDPIHDERVAAIIPLEPEPIDHDSADHDSPKYKTDVGPEKHPRAANTTAWRRADIGAANGHGNARSVARGQAVVANGGGIDGVQLLSPATIARIFEEQSNGIDLVLEDHQRFGIGYGLKSQASENIPDGNVCFWGGWGGSAIVVDLDRRVTFAYMMNRMHDGDLDDTRADDLLAATYNVLGA